MTILFTLSMPNRGSWNGRWSGEDKFYGKFVSFTSKKGKEKAAELIKDRSWHFSWGDGWGATVSAREVEGAEIRRLKRSCSGMCGDWMVESILACGEIRQTIRDESGKIVQSPYMEKKEEVMA